jgi:uncharacterized membrane protein YedE/YeeE
LELQTPAQKIVVFGLVLAFLAIVLTLAAWTFVSLSDAQQTTFSHWLDRHWAAILASVPTVAAAVLGYLFGHAKGKTAERAARAPV